MQIHEHSQFFTQNISKKIWNLTSEFFSNSACPTFHILCIYKSSLLFHSPRCIFIKILKSRKLSFDLFLYHPVWELYTQLFAGNWRRGKFAWSLSHWCWEKIRKKDVVMIAGRWSGDLRWKLDLQLWPRDQETQFPVETWWLSQTQEGQTEQIYPQTFDDPFFDSTGMI